MLLADDSPSDVYLIHVSGLGMQSMYKRSE
jgi:hypothetical protein